MIGYNDRSKYMCCQQIFRCENIKQLYLYQSLQRTLRYEYNEVVQHKEYLLHGCPSQVTTDIISNKLNRIYCHPSGTSIYLFNYFLDYFLERYIYIYG